MLDYRRRILMRIATVGTRWLPFADAATPEVPLSRLLRLALFQVTVGMALVLLVGTLNRVMIVEMGVPASLVGIMLALPLVFAPFRALIGFKSDRFVSAIGWRRVPFIWKGTMLQFGGFAIMPFALLVLSGFNEAHDAPPWIGHSAAAAAFLLVGAGVHMVQTVGLALATDLVAEEDQPKVVGLMYVMLLLGMIVAAAVYGALLANYSPLRLIQVIQGTAVVTIVLNVIALWQQEPRSRARAQAMAAAEQPSFSTALGNLAAVPGLLVMLAMIGLGTAGFGMADVLLEPFGGQVLRMTVAETTRLTVVLATGTLAGFALASRILGRGGRPLPLAWVGAVIGLPAFALIIAAGMSLTVPLLVIGTLAAGFGAGLFSHGTLTATIRTAPPDQVGLALGLWGTVQTCAAGLGVAFAGVLRDRILAQGGQGAAPYVPVFAIEIALLALAALVALRFLRPQLAKPAARPISTQTSDPGLIGPPT
jgi:BCD family chlorophyll transporter-like MFS transporter